MLQKSTLDYLKALKNNNNKPWFEKHRPDFENAKNDFNKMVEGLIAGIGKFDPQVASLTAKETMFRQNRDIRFSKDKRPYKHHMGTYINPGGKKINTPGYYFHLEPGKSIVAGGLYEPEPHMLAKVRQEIDYNLPELNKILEARDFKKYFPGGLNKDDILKRPPKGYENDNPAIAMLKLKSFTVSGHITDEALYSPSIKQILLKNFKSLQPLLAFLQRAIE
ncbi:MAG TPA: DUF2461 domain-containing protein [Ferruginibacter sp.]|nr:DUF2461 domain-containing protein [Ferruginibacter sp.]